MGMSVNGEHTCVGLRHSTAGTQDLLVRVLPRVMGVNKATKPRAIISTSCEGTPEALYLRVSAQRPTAAPEDMRPVSLNAVE